MPDDQAFLSARVPVTVRNSFKTLAASRGVPVQALLREVVGAYVREQQASIPNASVVIKTLQACKAELQAQGVQHLSLVGSVARNTANAESDIDLVVDFGETHKLSMIDIARVQYGLQDRLGARHKVDLSLWSGMNAAVEDTMRRDEIVIF